MQQGDVEFAKQRAGIARCLNILGFAVWVLTIIAVVTGNLMK